MLVTHSSATHFRDDLTLICCTNVCYANLERCREIKQQISETNWRIYKFDFVDLISASLKAPEQRKCDENNNNVNKAEVETPSEAESAAPSPAKDDESDEKPEKMKPKPMGGLFPLDLRSELKQRVGGKAGFSLKKSSTNIDINRDKPRSDPIPIKLPELRSRDLLKSIQEKQINKKAQDDSDDEGGQEKLSFKEKLQLIERSSSKSLVNPL